MAQPLPLLEHLPLLALKMETYRTVFAFTTDGDSEFGKNNHDRMRNNERVYSFKHVAITKLNRLGTHHRV